MRGFSLGAGGATKVNLYYSRGDLFRLGQCITGTFGPAKTLKVYETDLYNYNNSFARIINLN
jgi:hypothetical protein